MRRSRIRFLFTQLSAPVVWFSTVGIVGLLLVREFDALSWVDERPGSLLQVLGIGAVGAVIAFVGVLAMVAWGRLLVMIGLLTKEEARGYPNSKPWE